MKTIKLILVALIVITYSACNKTKYRSNRIDDNKWQIVTLTVDGVSDNYLPTLKFNDSDIYKEASKGWWYYGEEGHGEIAWQFRDNGKIFEFSNQADHAHGVEDVKAAEQAINYSGVYKVIKLSRNNFEIESNETFGNKGKKVIIKMNRKK